ncbi:TonB-dependent receptor [Roseateles cavernae]|uniref:TonB-dependent receptor n=1 Tax=Roseateles cavernae TaxID=3153578 RepID=UPI0032E481B0
MKLKKLARSLALIGIGAQFVGMAWAQGASEVQKVERVEITGSSIKRIASEGALPVQVISKEDIQRAGISSAEQLMESLAISGTGLDNMTSQVGIMSTAERGNNGAASANLRGLGAGSTLVLLNGRRTSVHGLKGGAVDLNSIPMAAVERVEILTDGASAIYGTDAIGGVINFILRRNYSGAEVRMFTDLPTEGGGSITTVSLLGGKGDLQKDRYNILVNLSFDDQDKLMPGQRNFVNGYQPARGIAPETVGTPFASQVVGTGSALQNFTLAGSGANNKNTANLLSLQGNCDSGPGMMQYRADLWTSNVGRTHGCTYDYNGAAVLIQPVQRQNLVSRAMFAINDETTAILEFVNSRTTSRKSFEPVQINNSTLAFRNSNGGKGAYYPVNGPYYQDLTGLVPGFDKTKGIAYAWRCVECGDRIIETESEASRLLIGLEGSLKGWDYKLGVSTAESEAKSQLAGGYMFFDKLAAAMASGKLNPWLKPGQTQTPEAMALLAGASATGTTLYGGKSKLSQVDGTITGDLFTLPAGPVGAAFGFDLRRETYNFNGSADLISNVFLAPGDGSIKPGKRDIKALFAELAIPIFKNLEATIAVRHDEYSDFGGTTNPKFALRYQPLKSLMFRSSYTEGFRAPSFNQLNSPTLESQTTSDRVDPVMCPANPGNPLYCTPKRYAVFAGGNPDLQPETAKMATFGVVFEPTDWITASADFWKVERVGRILALTDTQVLDNPSQFPGSFGRAPDGSLVAIRAGLINAAGDIAQGVDLALTLRGALAGGRVTGRIGGTYMDSYKTRTLESQPYVDMVGKFSSRDLYMRWKHNASLSYTRGPWSGTVSQTYSDGYEDDVSGRTMPSTFNPKVKAYLRHNLSTSYEGFKNTTITLGIKNLFNRDPSFSAHHPDNVAGAGWDARVGDPRGRALTAAISHKFF